MDVDGVLAADMIVLFQRELVCFVRKEYGLPTGFEWDFWKFFQCTAGMAVEVKMKKLYIILRIMLWSFVGVFIGSSFFEWYNYKTHPELYVMRSAPWYLNIEIGAIFTIIVVIVILTVMWIIRKKCQ